MRTRTYRAGAGAHAQQWPCKLLLSPESGRKLCCCLSDNYSRFSSLSWSISLTLWTASHFKFKQLWRHIPVRRRLRTIAAPFQRYCSELEPLGRSAKKKIGRQIYAWGSASLGPWLGWLEYRSLPPTADTRGVPYCRIAQYR